MSTIRWPVIARNVSILLLVALPATVLIEFAARATWPRAGEMAYDWTLAEAFSALAFSYVLSLPAFLAVGALHQSALVVLGARAQVFDRRAARAAADLVAFGPLLIIVRDDLHMLGALSVGAIIFSIATENPRLATAQRICP